LRSLISRQDDKYRAAYGQRVTPHPRQCVFIGTTNADSGYLRDAAGNRRFWPITATGSATCKPWELSQHEVNQIWAEALMLQKADENLYIDASDILAHAEKEQRAAMETDEREGIVVEYLNTLLPENWANMKLYDRQEWLRDTKLLGTVPRKTVCPQEIWAECFRKFPADLTYKDSMAINQILAKLEGWKRSDNPTRFPLYGLCRGYEKLLHSM